MRAFFWPGSLVSPVLSPRWSASRIDVEKPLQLSADHEPKTVSRHDQADREDKKTEIGTPLCSSFTWLKRFAERVSGRKKNTNSVSLVTLSASEIPRLLSWMAMPVARDLGMISRRFKALSISYWRALKVSSQCGDRAHFSPAGWLTLKSWATSEALADSFSHLLTKLVQ